MIIETAAAPAAPAAPGTRDTGRRVLRRIAVSLTIGTFAYLLTVLADQPEIWGIMLSVFIGGVTLVVQFLIEFETRLAQIEATELVHSARIETMVQEGFSKINTATRLFHMVEDSAVPTDAVVDLVRHATMVTHTPELMFLLAQSEIERLSHFLKELGDGASVSYEGEARDWLLALTERAQVSIDATSLTTIDARGRGYTDGGFWVTDLGQRYLAAQHEAVQRGVTVRRVFVILRSAVPATIDTGLTDVWRLHRDSGVDVRVLAQDEYVGTHLEVVDFVLFDQAISFETTATSMAEDTSRPTQLSTRLDLRQDRVESRVRRFEDLWERAKVLE